MKSCGTLFAGGCLLLFQLYSINGFLAPYTSARRRCEIFFSSFDHETIENKVKPTLFSSFKAPVELSNSLQQLHNVNKLFPVVAAVSLLLSPSVASASDSILSTATSAAASGESGLIQSFLLIFISEIGDKTFFIAGLLAAKYGRLISFSGSIGALALMTIISTVLGQLFHAVPESITRGVPFDDYIAVAAFAYFGIKTLLEAAQLPDGDSSGIEEEKAEAEDIVNEVSKTQNQNSAISLALQTFSLVFAAEIGDRSFLSTIALSAALNPFAVALGAVSAHAVATGIAVIGGAILSKYLSEKVIGYIGGSLFLVFAVTTALGLF
jgi:putative Ca2+/H+ antiporter (TMEM165/GDT1 family)